MDQALFILFKRAIGIHMRGRPTVMLDVALSNQEG
jgi:hypothetical protein